MKFKEKIFLAYKDVTNRKFRSFLTIIAISVGSLLLVSMMGLGDAITDQTKKMVESFGVINEISIIPVDISKGMDEDGGMSMGMGMPGHGEDSVGMTEVGAGSDVGKETNNMKKNITQEDLEKMLKIDGTESVRASINTKVTAAKIGNGDYVSKSIDVSGFDFKYNKDFSDEILVGNSFTEDTNGILIGEGLLKSFGIEDPKEAIGKTIKLKAEYPEMNGIKVKEPIEIEGEIVGVTTKKSSYGNSILMSSTLVEPVTKYYFGNEDYIKENGYDSASVFGKEGADIGELNKAIMKETGFLTFSLELISSMLSVLTGVIKSILSLAGIIVLIVASLGLVNTMTMTLQEKKSMIGVMRAVGASRGNIRWIFVMQSLILGLAGGVLGAVTSAIGIVFVNEYVTKSSGLIIPVSPFNIILAISVTILVSLIAGLIPSGKAAKLDVVETLSAE